VICSEHFLEIKSVDDPSFLPNLFPLGTIDSMIAELQGTKQHITEKDVSCDFSVLEKVVDRLPVLSAVDPARRGQSDTSHLQKAFRELACHVCRLLVAHDSELVIEGTVGVTVDGGARVMLLHFSDQVRKTEAAAAEKNTQNSASEPTAVGSVFHDMAADDATPGTIKVETSVRASEETIPTDGNAECGTKFPSSAAHSSQYSSASSKILSDLAQQTTNTMYTNSGSPSDVVASSTHKRKPEQDSSSVCDKPKQQTLLRELLCAPLPPKRPCRPVNTAPVAPATGVLADVVRPRRPTANSTVLGGLLRTGTYQRDPNFSPLGSVYGREVRPKHERGSVAQGGYGSTHMGDQGSQFGGNAVRALLKLASEHAVSGRPDLLHNSKHRESAASQNEGLANDGLGDLSIDQVFSIQQSNFAGCNLTSTASEFVNSSQNIARNDASATICSSSELTPLSVKQEVLDPSYE